MLLRRLVCVGSQNASQRGNVKLSSLAKPSASEGVFELRTCSLKPECVASYVELKERTEKKFPSHMKPLWYWFTELGGMNEVVSLWKYDSYAHRSEVKNEMQNDSALQDEYFNHVKPMLLSQTNMILYRCPWYNLHFPETKGVYELAMYNIQNGKYDQVVHRLVQGLDHRLNYSAPVGIFLTDVGPLTRLVLLWSYEDMDKRDKIRKAAYANEIWNETVRDMNIYVNESSNKILVPASFSPRH